MLKSLTIMVTTCLLFCYGASAINSAYPDSWLAGPLWVLENVCYMRNLPLFAMGMLLNEIKNQRGNIKLNIAGICYFAFVFQAIDLRDHNPAATVLLFGLLTACAWGKVPPLRFPPLLFISTISYTLYLFHNNIGSTLIYSLEKMGTGPLVAVVIATVLSIAVGAATTLWFEQPLTKRLRAWWKRRKSAVELTMPSAANSDAVPSR
jgi:peptidoglycan/LPS O-acetylase OafA/YrhL